MATRWDSPDFHRLTEVAVIIADVMATKSYQAISKHHFAQNVATLSLALSLQWRHNERDVVSNHHPHDCLLNRLFKAHIKETSKLRVTGLCEGNSPVTGEYPTQRSSNAENVSIWWRHNVIQSIQIALQTLRHWDREWEWPTFCRRHFEMHFLEWVLNIKWISLKYVPWV